MPYSDKDSFCFYFNQLTRDSVPFIFVINYDLKSFFISPIATLPKGILFNFNGFTNTNSQIIDKKLHFKYQAVNFDTYKQSFENVRKHLELGNSYLINLTFPSDIDTNFDLAEIFHVSKSIYKFKFFDEFVFFSPETFVKIIDNQIFTYPMKGTIDASIKNAENLILNDEKELAEHITIVDLLRNDLNMISNNVRVRKFRFLSDIISRNKKLYQVSSEIRGELKDNYKSNICDLFLKMLPAGSVTGAPKKKTLEIINESEIYERGFYTGVAGVFDGKNFDSCVMIRFIERKDNKMIYKSGGGITVYSDIEKEYKEMMDKIYIPV